MTRNSIFNSLRWLIPFACFIAGYYCINIAFPTERTVTVPNLMGTSTTDALQMVSQANLCLKTIETRESKNFLFPMVLEQIPAANLSVKPRSTVYIIVAQPPAIKLTPDYSQITINNEQSEHAIKNVMVLSPKLMPSNSFIAQYPQSDTPLVVPITIYRAQNENVFIMPDCTGHLVFEVEDLCNKNGLRFEIHPSTRSQADKLIETSRVIAQQPQPGTLFELASAPTLHIKT